MMRTDLEIKEDVLDELEWQPNIDETQIGVIVKNGIVTLMGTVDSYSKKLKAEKAAKIVKGVKAVAEDIVIVYDPSFRKTDTEIAQAVVNALKWNASVPPDKITIKVEDGWVYLKGEVMWAFQKDAAQKAVENLPGVKYVMNNILLKHPVNPVAIKSKISKAYGRSAEIDAKNVTVNVDGHKVKLTGRVHSLTEKNEAQKVAYFAPGVYEVENKLEVID